MGVETVSFIIEAYPRREEFGTEAAGDRYTGGRFSQGGEMALHPSVAQHLPKIRELAEEYGIDKLEIFGSSMTDAFDPERSDVDFIVHYPDGYEFGSFLKRFLDLEEDLSEVIHRPAQLVMTSALKHERFRQNANRTRMLIYDSAKPDQRDRRHQEVLSASSRSHLRHEL